MRILGTAHKFQDRAPISKAGFQIQVPGDIMTVPRNRACGRTVPPCQANLTYHPKKRDPKIDRSPRRPSARSALRRQARDRKRAQKPQPCIVFPTPPKPKRKKGARGKQPIKPDRGLFGSFLTDLAVSLLFRLNPLQDRSQLNTPVGESIGARVPLARAFRVKTGV